MQDDQIDLVFKALAHAERRRILRSLHLRPEQSLFEICAASLASGGEPLTRQTVSQHLDALERAGLVKTTWKGRIKAHSAHLAPLREAIDIALRHYLGKGTS